MTDPRVPATSNDGSMPVTAPENPAALLDVGTLEPNDLLAIDEVCDAYESAWRTGPFEPDIDEFLQEVRPELRPLAHSELLAVAQHWRRQKDRVAESDATGSQNSQHYSESSDHVYLELEKQFQLEQRLGSGASGEVWKATHLQTGELVALKIPHRKLLESLSGLIRFCREARWQARLSHPRIAAPEDVIMAGEVPVLVSRYVDGVTLRDYLARNRLGIEQAVELIIQLADGLEYAHAMGITHRDLKPANVMLERLPDGAIDLSRPVIIDFGLAVATDQLTVTHDSQTLGTPAYMSPEQARGGSHAAGPHSDVYALGVILFETLTGSMPIQGDGIPTQLHNVIYQSPKRLRQVKRDIPGELEQICDACLRKSPKSRYQSARDFAEDLRRYRRRETIRMQRPNALSRVAHWGARHPALLTSMLSLLIAVATTSLLIVRESYLDRLQIEYDKSTEAIYSARSAQEKLESHLAAYRMGRIGTYWALNNPEQARALLAECPLPQHTWEWRYLNRLVNCYQRELQHASSQDEGKYSVRSLALSADGKTLFSGARSGSLYRWDLTEPVPTKSVVDTQLDAILAIECSRDGSTLCYGTNDGMLVIRSWHQNESRLSRSQRVNGPAIHALKISPDGNYLAIGGGAMLAESHDPEQGFLIIQNLSSGAVVFEEYSLSNTLVDLAWDAKGERLLGAGGTSSSHAESLRGASAIWLWNQNDWTKKTIAQSGAVKGVAWSPVDSNEFATAGWNRARTIWDAKTLKTVRELPQLSSGATTCEYIPDGNVLVTGCDDGTCSLWALDSHEPLATYHAHPQGLSCMLVSQEGQLVTGGMDEFIRFWDAKPPADATVELRKLGKVVSCAPWRDHLIVAVNNPSDDSSKLFALPISLQLNQSSVQELASFPSQTIQIACDRHDDSELAVILNDGTLNLLPLIQEVNSEGSLVKTTGKPRWRVLPFMVNDVYIQSRLNMRRAQGRTYVNLPEFATIASSNATNQNRIWMLASFESEFESITEQTSGTGRAFALSPKGDYLVTTSDETAVRIWDGGLLQTINTLKEHERVISAVAFNPLGTLLATGSWDRQINLWNFADSRRLQTLTGHTGNILAISFHPTEPRMVSAGSDRQIRVWDLNTGLETVTLSGHQSPVTTLCFDEAGDHLVSVDEDGQVRCW